MGIQVYKKKRRLSRTSRKGRGGWEFFLLLKLTPFKTGAAENHRNKSLTTGSWVPGQRKTRNLYLEKEDCRWGTHNTAHSSVLVRLVPAAQADSLQVAANKKFSKLADQSLFRRIQNVLVQTGCLGIPDLGRN